MVETRPRRPRVRVSESKVMRYKDRTPDAQAICGRYLEFIKDAPHREFLGKPHKSQRAELSQHTISVEQRQRACVGRDELGYLCGSFVRASERYTNWPRRWILIWHTTEHPPRVCRGSRKRKKAR